MNKKEEILCIAKKLFNEKGYGHVTMRDISKEMGISVGNLTYHFSKKQEILQAIMNQTLQELLFPQIIDLNSLDLFLSNLIDSLESERFYFSDYIQIAKLHPEGMINVNKIKERFESGLLYLKEQKLFNECFNEKVIQSLVQMMMYSHLAWIGEEKRDKKLFMKMHWDLFESYLSQQGKEEYERLKS